MVVLEDKMRANFETLKKIECFEAIPIFKLLKTVIKENWNLDELLPLYQLVVSYFL